MSFKRVAVVGAQNTGKSTLVKYFADNTSTWKTPTTSYRDVIKEDNLKINRNGTKESQDGIFSYINTVLFSLLGDSSNYIFDRSLIDVYCYSLWLYENVNHCKDDYWIESQYKAVLYYMDHFYTHIYFIPFQPGIELVNDNVRDIDSEYISNINSNFINFFLNIKDYDYKLKICTTNDLKKRYTELHNFIKD